MKQIIISSNYLLYATLIEQGEIYVISPFNQPKKFIGDIRLWCIRDDYSKTNLYKTSGKYSVVRDKNGYTISFDSDYTITEIDGIPACDVLENSFDFSIDNISLTDTVAGFYWKNLLCQCAEKSAMKIRDKWRSGYVLSTLETNTYAGTYPAVDHEFHIRARLAMGDEFDVSLVKRMMLLQIKTMLTDRGNKMRIPCSVQPNGKREYKVMRKSLDKSVKAQMFPLTGIIELCEEMYNYYCLTKDIEFIKQNIKHIEAGMLNLERLIDEKGLLHAQVYYEDQVMKDDLNAQAQAFAINSLMLLARLENVIGNNERVKHYSNLSNILRASYQNYFWNEDKKLYIDYVNKDGSVHNHFHLLSNALSVTLNINDDKTRDEVINKQIADSDNEFQRFPSFLSADVSAYNESEIGSGGPYDLCAAGRYWCHDAKYRRSLGRADMIKNQLFTVMDMAKSNDYYMGERYDMNYAYYNTGEDVKQPWHGASKYYEYPCTFIDVLIHDYFGIQPDEMADFRICPCIVDNSKIKLEALGIKYSYNNGIYKITNISDKEINIKLKHEIITLKPYESNQIVKPTN